MESFKDLFLIMFLMSSGGGICGLGNKWERMDGEP